MKPNRAHYTIVVEKDGERLILTFDDLQIADDTRQALRHEPGVVVVDYTRHGYTTFRSVESALQLVRDF